MKIRFWLIAGGMFIFLLILGLASVLNTEDYRGTGFYIVYLSGYLTHILIISFTEVWDKLNNSRRE